MNNDRGVFPNTTPEFNDRGVFPFRTTLSGVKRWGGIWKYHPVIKYLRINEHKR